MDVRQSIDTYAKDISCIPQVTQRSPNLSGKGVIIAVLDSGIDYFSPEFRLANGKTRILAIWDQAAIPNEEKGTTFEIKLPHYDPSKINQE